ncbi:hypothetical protein WJX72_012164 [[Myrmecia] bisecta]|uniref:Uncharacterized protein n=1 Tax=[Myrmecia] bisecta TaxID=41462 RepID=A0AAW1QTS3_9CHLO
MASSLPKRHWDLLILKLTIYLRQLVPHLRRLLDWLFEEFEPWFKWVVFDALLALLIGVTAKRVRSFAEGATQFAAFWAEQRPGQPAWSWVEGSSRFASSLGGGYLALRQQRSAHSPGHAMCPSCSSGPSIKMGPP